MVLLGKKDDDNTSVEWIPCFHRPNPYNIIYLWNIVEYIYTNIYSQYNNFLNIQQLSLLWNAKTRSLLRIGEAFIVQMPILMPMMPMVPNVSILPQPQPIMSAPVATGTQYSHHSE